VSALVPPTGPEPLSSTHDLATFDCGKAPLNTFLLRFALLNQFNATARTYVVHRENRVVGYYSLAAAAVELVSAPPRVGKGLPRLPIPLTLLARLAVDLTEQGNGLGPALLKDAFKKFLAAQEIVASRALLVHAKDDEAAKFYLHCGFEPSHIDKHHLYLLTKNIKKTLGLAQ
jgi:GNAT superfamily N-acetyltransferase